MRAFGYLRVSKERLGQISPEAQRDAITEHCHVKGWTVVEWFSDIGWSATTYRPLEMPGFSEMVRRAEDGDADVVVFYRADRAVREHIGDFQIVRASLKSCGVEMAFAGREYDDSPEGEFSLDLDLILSKLEARRLGARLRSMHKRLAREGKYGGNLAPFGWRRVREADGQQRLVLDPTEASQRRQMHAWVWDGWTLQRIADALNGAEVTTAKGTTWNAARLSKVLHAKVQLGVRVADGEEVATGRIEPLLTREEYERTAAVLAARQCWPERTSPRALRGNLVRCGNCGHAMYLQRHASGNKYRCEGQHQHSCGRGASILERLLVSEVEGLLLERLKTLARCPQTPPPVLPDIGGLLREERASTEALGRLVAMYAAGEVTDAEWSGGRAAANARLTRARQRLEEARKQLGNAPPDADREALSGITPDHWRLLPVDAQHDIYRVLIDHVTINPMGQGQRVEVVWL